MKYAIIQERVTHRDPNKFGIIRGERAGGGYPVGFEGKDWEWTKHRGLTIERAREILKTL